MKDTRGLHYKYPGELYTIPYNKVIRSLPPDRFGRPKKAKIKDKAFVFPFQRSVLFRSGQNKSGFKAV